MNKIKVYNLKNKSTIVENGEVADTFVTRLNGLMFKSKINDGYGLIINPCNSIHMFFMKFPLDVLFVDKNNIVVALEENIKPWKISKIYLKANYVIELPIGTIKKTNTKIGDEISIQDICQKY